MMCDSTSEATSAFGGAVNDDERHHREKSFTKTKDIENLISTPASTTSLFELVPIPICVEIVQYLSLTDGRHLYQTCKYLWKISSTVESHRCQLRMIHYPTIEDFDHIVHQELEENALATNIRFLIYRPIYTSLINLMVLDLCSLATDSILMTLRGEVPNLQELYMIGSNNNLTDIGLLSLLGRDYPSNGKFYTLQEINLPVHDTVRCRTLRYVDITGCDNITYYATILLRERMIQSDFIIRRQPKWMDGHYCTLFSNEGVHTYYADGSFLYNRSSLSYGYICDLWQWPNTTTETRTWTDTSQKSYERSIRNPIALDNEGYGISLCLSDFQPPDRSPRWAFDVFYPSVNKLLFETSKDDGISKNTNNENSMESVIVVQGVGGFMNTPISYDDPLFRNETVINQPFGSSVFRDIEGNFITTTISNESPPGAYQRVTKIQKYPLQNEQYNMKYNIADPTLQHISNQRNCFMPPVQLVSKIRASEEERIRRNYNAIDTVHFGEDGSIYSDEKFVRHCINFLHTSMNGRWPTTAATTTTHSNYTSRRLVRVIQRQSRLLHGCN